MYCYGTENGETYCDLTEAIENVKHDADGIEARFVILIEFKASRKSGYRYCHIIDDHPDCDADCVHYEPRNGISGICSHNFCGVVATGEKWKVYTDGTYEKISEMEAE